MRSYSQVILFLIALTLHAGSSDSWAGTQGFHSLLKTEYSREAYKTRTVSLSGNVSMEFIWVPPGVFCMGSELGPSNCQPHTVEITTGFWLGKYEVTQEQWFAMLSHNPSYFKGYDRPVENVTWNNS